MEKTIGVETETKSDIDIQIDNCCRMCLVVDSDLISIFDPIYDYNGRPISSMINECCPCKVTYFDDYPQQICKTCNEELKMAFEFRKRAEESYSIISAYLNRSTEIAIKKEIDSIKRSCTNQSNKNSGNDNFNEAAFLSNEDSEDERPISKLMSEIKIEKYEINSECNDNFAYCNDLKSENEENEIKQEIEICYPKDLNHPSVDRMISISVEEQSIKVSKESNINKCSDIFKNENTSKDEAKNSKLNSRSCKICLKVFARQYHLKRHVHSVHKGQRPFRCSKCSSTFTTSEYLKIHSKICGIPKKCPLCDVNYTSIRQRNIHIKEEHPSFCQKKFSCNYCELTFSSRRECKKHKCSVHDHKLKCGAIFQDQTTSHNHLKRHKREKKCICKFCGKGFFSEYERKLHEKYHTGDKKFKCETCGYSFVKSTSLKVHMRKHTGEKPFKCKNCPCSYSQSNGLKTHIRRVHTGERFICDVNYCGKSFLQLYLLNRHKNNEHNIETHSNISRVTKIYESAANTINEQ